MLLSLWIKSRAKVEMTISIATDSSSMVVYSSKVVSLSGEYQVCHLYDVELVVQADSVLNRSVGEQQMCKVIVRKAVDMVGNIAGYRRVLSA